MSRTFGKTNRIYLKWAWVLIKRNLCSMSYYLLVIFLVLGTFLINSVSKEYSKSVRTLVLNEGSEAGEKTIQSLMNNPPEGFEFVSLENKRELIDKVTRGEAACGIIFTPELDEALSDEDYDGQVIYYQYAGSVDGYVVKEIVFPELQKYGCRGTLNKYLEDKKIGEEVREEVLDFDESYLEGTKLQLFSIVDVGETNNICKSSVNLGRAAFFILFLVILVIVVSDSVGQDRDFYKGIPSGMRIILRLEAVLANLLMTVGAGIMILLIFL